MARFQQLCCLPAAPGKETHPYSRAVHIIRALLLKPGPISLCSAVLKLSFPDSARNRQGLGWPTCIADALWGEPCVSISEKKTLVQGETPP